MPKSDKPSYRVPSMDEIRALPWNGHNVVSLFAGTGGSSTGYRMAGFRVLWASEFIDAARDSYAANKAPYTVLDGRDIRTVQPADILAATGLQAGELDLLDGSPPCASFSTAGKREAGWGKAKAYSDKHQRTDDLFFEYSRILRGLQPKAFVAENVSGLVKGTAKGYFLDILRELKGCGYRVEARVLDAQWLGVPQARQRLIFIGVREDLGLAPAFPAPLGYRYTVRDALPHIARVKHGGEPDNWQTAERPSCAIVASGANRAESAYLSGGTHVEALAGPPPARMIVGNDGFEPVWGSLDQPSPTIMASGARTSGMVELSSPPEPAAERPSETEGAPALPDFEPASRVVHDTSGLYSTGDVTDRPCPAITVGVHSVNSLHFKVEKEASLDGYAIGTEWDKLAPGGQSDKYFNLVRTDPGKASPTITAMGATPGLATATHPTERRKFSIAELRRICGFPDDFTLVGSYAQQWERCGRAVPPMMMSHIAAAVRDGVLDKQKPGTGAGLAVAAAAADQAPAEITR